MKVNSEPQPLVSVVILCYNQQDYIEDAIDSVMGQTYSNIEIIISDDGSCDNSRDIIRKKVNDWKHKDRVKLFLSEENTAFACAEEALNSAAGKYICAMGGDDMMSDEKIAKQVEFLERNKGEYSLCFTWIECIGCESIKVDMMQRWFNIDNIPHSDMIRTLYLNGNIFAAPSFMMRRDLFEKLGGFDFSLRQTQDYVLWLKYIVENRAYIIPEKLTKYRVVKGSVSDAEVDKGVDIRTLEELINEIYEIVVNLEGEVFQKAFLLEDKESIDKTDMNCRKMLLFYRYAMEEMNVRAGEIAVRLYFHYRKEEGFTKLLKERYGLNRKTMYDFTSKVTLAAYALQNDNRIRLYKKANEKHRLDLNNIDKNNIEMVNELLDILDDKKASAVTRDHIIALYDFCRENNNNMDDFEKMIHALKEKATFL